MLLIKKYKEVIWLMRIGKYLSTLTKPELEEIEKKANFSDEEKTIYYMLSKGKSLTEISINNQISLSTLKRRINNIKLKVGKINENNNHSK